MSDGDRRGHIEKMAYAAPQAGATVEVKRILETVPPLPGGSAPASRLRHLEGCKEQACPGDRPPRRDTGFETCPRPSSWYRTPTTRGLAPTGICGTPGGGEALCGSTFVIVARAVALHACVATDIDRKTIDSAILSETRSRSVLVFSVGYAAHAGAFDRPRLPAFEEACRVASGSAATRSAKAGAERPVEVVFRYAP